MSKARATDERHRIIEGIRCRFVYDYRRMNINICPDESDLATAETLPLLKFWYIVGAWVKDVSRGNPLWRIDGEFPDPEADDALDLDATVFEPVEPTEEQEDANESGE